MGDGSEAFDFVLLIDCAKANISTMNPTLWTILQCWNGCSHQLEETRKSY